MERIAFGKNTLNTRHSRTDRFIAPRSLLLDQCRRQVLSTVWDLPQRTDFWHRKFVPQRQYARHIEDVFELNDLLSSVKSLPHFSKSTTVQPWPCVPRKKRYLHSADSVLDLPFYRYALFPELLDWSKDDILVAALGTKYHMWSWRSQGVLRQGLALTQLYCCKFDPKGELLALGTESRSTELHDPVYTKLMTYSSCRCKLTNSYGPVCGITAVDWSPSGASFAMGCSQGMICAYTRDSYMLAFKRLGHQSIQSVRISPNARFVVASLTADRCVFVLNWPDFSESYVVGFNQTIVKTISWHPWRSSLLAIGSSHAEDRSVVTFWDASSNKLNYVIVNQGKCYIDSMLFSPRTGELVLSLWNSDINERRKSSRIVVLSDPFTVVDQWGEEGGYYLDRVRTMVLSPDGSKLATATVDEDLIIWNFLPEKKEKKRSKNFWKLPVLIDESLNGYSIR